MDTLNEFEENLGNSEQLNSIIISVIKDFPILIEKSQLPSSKEKKVRALQQARKIITTNTGKNLDEKQILKKISNMKVQVKKKTDANQTGNRKCVLSSWEKELYKILKGDENPTITKMPSSISAGFEHSSCSTLPPPPCNTLQDTEASTSSMNLDIDNQFSRSEVSPFTSRSFTPIPTPTRGTKRKSLPGETEETLDLTTSELQRVLLLAQLKYIRAKMKRLEENERTENSHDNMLDGWQNEWN